MEVSSQQVEMEKEKIYQTKKRRSSLGEYFHPHRQRKKTLPYTQEQQKEIQREQTKKKFKTIFKIGWIVVALLVVAAVVIAVIATRDGNESTTSGDGDTQNGGNESGDMDDIFDSGDPFEPVNPVNPVNPTASPSTAPTTTSVVTPPPSPTTGRENNTGNDGSGSDDTDATTTTTLPPTTTSPTATPIQSTRETIIASKLLTITNSSFALLEDTTSPQNKAYNWILNNDAYLSLLYPFKTAADNTTSTPTEENEKALTQRYILTLLFFETNEFNTWDVCADLNTNDDVDECENVEEDDTRRFLSQTSECDWYGITCDVDGSIVSIDLSDNGLRNTIPPEIGQLSSLQHLILHKNRLSSTLPTTIGLLANLEILNLNNNRIEGPMPTEIGSMTKLQILNVRKNDMDGPMSPEMFTSSNLEYLDLSGNDFVGPLPTEMFTSTINLVFVDLTGNPIGGSIPTELKYLTQLASLEMGSADLTGTLPGEIFQTTDIVTSNRVTSMLETLSLEGNSLNGSLPEELFNVATSLRILDLGINDFTGELSENAGNLLHLEQLLLWYNNFDGSIPSTLGSLTLLEIMSLDNNQFNGTMPPEVCNLVTFASNSDGGDAGSLIFLASDCKDDDEEDNMPFVECSCCHSCQ
mmetsp:Transcript_3698/g.5398  ORF Transcript_3698/g.5398 Transcript_3698/m.5398 type:complete len:638 (-) Transcript_3698:1220-3133(-)